MKDMYTEKLNSEDVDKSIVAEPVVDTYIAHNTQDFASGLDGTSKELPPCTYTDEEVQKMLEEAEQENLFIPDSLVRKMFA